MVYFWRKRGSKRFTVDGKAVDVFWDLKGAKFNGETEPTSEYYVAVVCDQEVVLLLGNLKKEAYRRTGCRPSLIDPILVSKREHIFGKRKFSTVPAWAKALLRIGPGPIPLRNTAQSRHKAPDATRPARMIEADGQDHAPRSIGENRATSSINRAAGLQIQVHHLKRREGSILC